MAVFRSVFLAIISTLSGFRLLQNLSGYILVIPVERSTTGSKTISCPNSNILPAPLAARQGRNFSDDTVANKQRLLPSRKVVPVLPHVLLETNNLSSHGVTTGYYAVQGRRSFNNSKDAMNLTVPPKVKVFGLGLSRTATASMAEAMDLIGYRTIHSDSTLGHFMHHSDVSPNLTGVYDTVDSVWNIPTAAYYRELHQAYPDAKFILTIRNSTRDWFSSVERYQKEYLYYYWGCAVPERVQRLHEFVYGTRNVEPSWMNAMERHNQAVVDYFQDYPDQLLVINIDDNNVNHFHKLCCFIGSNEGPCSQLPNGVFPSFPKTATSAAMHHVIQKQQQCPTTGSALGKTTSKYAYVLLLCDAGQDLKNRFVSMALVLAQNIRKFDKSNDIVLLVHGDITKEQEDAIYQFGIKLLKVEPLVDRVELEDPMGWYSQQTTSCFMSKIHVLRLTQYEKVFYLDTDMFFKTDPSIMFQVSGFVANRAASLAPMNGGLFIATPSLQSFADLVDIANSAAFEPKDGWLGHGSIPEWTWGKPRDQMRNWTFQCGHSDQGIFYYYFDRVAQIGNINNIGYQPGKTHYSMPRVDFVHFAGRDKPYKKDKNNLDDNSKLWFATWEEVSKKIQLDVVL